MEAIGVVEVVESAAYGTGKHVFELCRGLVEREFHVALIASTRRDPGFRERMNELGKLGVNCIEMDMARGICPVCDTAAFFKLRKHFRKLSPHVVHGHASKGGFLARAAAHSLGIKATVYTPHCFAFGTGRGGARTKLYRALERRAGRWTARLVAVSRWEKEFAAANRVLPDERIILIPNGLSDADLECCKTPAAFPAELGVAPEDRVICFIGRLWRQKGPDVLIRAFAQVPAKEPRAKLLLVGDGPEEESLRKLARNLGVSQRVIFVGAREDSREILAASQVFVLPSRWESAPYSLLEAMAAGVPIVASYVGGVPEMLDDGRCGEVVAPDDAEALANAILVLLLYPERAREMAQAARERVRRLYRLSESIDRTADLYRELADGKP